MARFTGPLIIERIEDPYWVVHDPFAYVDSDLRVDVPTGFITDLASIPRAVWSVFPPDDSEYAQAAVVHDAIYESHQLPRDQADAMLYRAMAVLGTPTWKRWIIYRAVRWFGASAYASGPARQKERLAIDAIRTVIRNGRETA